MNLIPTVFASQKPSLPSAEVAFASFGCEGCGNHFSVQASMSTPFCVLCGCDNTTRLQDSVTASALDPITEEANCAVVECSCCNQHLVMSSAVEDNGVVFCSVCGTDNHFVSEAASDDDDEDEDEEDACVKIGRESQGRTEVELEADKVADPQTFVDANEPPHYRESNPAAAKRDKNNEEKAAAKCASGKDDKEGAKKEDPGLAHERERHGMLKKDKEEDAGCDEFKVGDPQTFVNNHEPEGHRDSNPADAHRNNENEEVKATKGDAPIETIAARKGRTTDLDKVDRSELSSVPGADGRLPEFKFPSEEEVYKNSVAKDKLDQKSVQPDGTDNCVNEDAFKGEQFKAVPLLDIVRTSQPGNPPIRFGRVEASIVAYVGPYTVAVLEEANVNANVREHFKTQAYLEAIANSVEISGFDETLASFGFEHLTIKSNDTAIAALANDRVEARAAELASAKNQASLDEVQACLAIASTGITKQFFDAGNPIRDALVASLENAGLRNPHRIVDEALASSQDGYNKALIAEAFNLLSMPVEARNAIAKTVVGSRHVYERANAGVHETTSTVVASLRQPMVGVNEEVTASVPRQSGVGSNARGNAVHRTVTQLRSEVGKGRLFGG